MSSEDEFREFKEWLVENGLTEEVFRAIQTPEGRRRLIRLCKDPKAFTPEDPEVQYRPDPDLWSFLGTLRTSEERRRFRGRTNV